ncbi:MAG: DUF1800 domain-containing protein [Verrucomicrobia bacterium]|nr:DUF1800 domain-containing protein [Verrucomicrobiota bacterium]
MLAPLPPARWNRACAAHLLRRAGFGGPPAQVDALCALGPDAAVRALVDGPQPARLPAAPAWAKPQDLRARREAMLDVASLAGALSGAAEIQRRFQRDTRREEFARTRELAWWWLREMRTTNDPLREKLTLFWHGHFATSVQKVRNAYWMWLQNDTLRRHARGPFGALVKAISRDPAMILWLDLRESRAVHPNENFARELMELFTLGEGHYTEKDVTEAARAFTGYRIQPETQGFRFARFEHDAGEKEIFGRRGRHDGDAVIDLILAQPACARFLAGKLWTFFTGETPAPALLEQLATTWRNTGGETAAFLRQVFRSEEFYAARIVGAQIKSPIHWLVSNARLFESDYPSPLVALFAMRQLGQILFLPPSVKGWDGERAWISTSTLLARYNLAALFVEPPPPGAQAAMQQAVRDLGYEMDDDLAQTKAAGPVDLTRLVSADVRRDPAALVDQLAARLFAGPLPAREREAFLAFLRQKPAPPDDATLRSLLHLMLSTPHFQLC